MMLIVWIIIGLPLCYILFPEPVGEDEEKRRLLRAVGIPEEEINKRIPYGAQLDEMRKEQKLKEKEEYVKQVIKDIYPVEKHEEMKMKLSASLKEKE